jgi:hypothetical protein
MFRALHGFTVTSQYIHSRPRAWRLCKSITGRSTKPARTLAWISKLDNFAVEESQGLRAPAGL